jgi:hypothetical protein
MRIAYTLGKLFSRMLYTVAMAHLRHGYYL